MQTHSAHRLDPPRPSVGAESLKRALSRGASESEGRNLFEKIDFWQDAIRGKYRKSPDSAERAAAENVLEWYWGESRSRSYQAPSWKVSPERSELFRQFREDPNYHLKCLVELVARGLVEEMLKSDGLDATVTVTSDSDDVFSGVDYVVEIRDPKGGKQYVGIDLAVSENPEYLEKKGMRTETVCYEFNAFMQHGKRTIPRQVFAVPPAVMSRFLTAYVDSVAVGRIPGSKEILELLERSKTPPSVSSVRERVQSRTADILH